MNILGFPVAMETPCPDAPVPFITFGPWPSGRVPLDVEIHDDGRITMTLPDTPEGRVVFALICAGGDEE